ncbi:MAG TPA: RHS repeat-associated core domain-containing protein, partial [Pirellulales bacterium]
NTGIVPGTQSFTQEWILDPTSNWIQFQQSDSSGNLDQVREANTVNEITEISLPWVNPTYDAAGNMTLMPQPANPTVGDDGVYDAWNRLMSLSSVGSPIASNVYDALNRRASETAAGTTRHSYYTSAWQGIEERVGSSAAADRQFIWGLRYIDDLILRDRGSERFYALQDPNWNVSSITADSGNVEERYKYAAYGQPTFLTAGFSVLPASQFAWETTYCGYRWDYVTALFEVRNRVYHAVLGVWISPEAFPLPSHAPPMPAYLNRYAFDNSNPIVFVDPDGRWPLFIVTGIIGAVAGGIIGGVSGGVRGALQGGLGGAFAGAGAGALRGAIAGGITGATLGLVAPVIAVAGIGGWVGGALAGGTAGAIGETATEGLEIAVGVRGTLDPWQIGTSTAIGAVTGGTFCRPALPGTQQVTHWSPAGSSPTTLSPGMWVQTGGPSPLNYVKSGTLEQGYPYANALTQNVPRAALANPPSWEAPKALLGQYIYRP